MKIRILLAAVVASFISSAAVAQVKDEAPKGSAIINVFGNFHTGFGDGKDDRGFQLDRSYFGYQYNLGKGLSIKAVMDVGQSKEVDDYQRIAYIKNAQITWKKGDFTLNGGLISTTQFNMVEKFWGYRYIYKSFQDQYKFGNSADLGMSFSYKFADFLQADAIIVNGEGYKKIQSADGLQYGVGITATPLKGLTLRVYGGINEMPGSNGDEAGDQLKNVLNFSAFAGYKGEKFSIGAEYNTMANSSGVEDANQYGYSIYGNVNLSKVSSLYVRYDNLSSKDDWNLSKDEEAFIIGSQFKLGKYVKLAPNFRLASPKAPGADSECGAYISFYFGL